MNLKLITRLSIWKASLIFLSTLSILYSCNKADRFVNFEKEKWQDDKKACNGFREGYFKNILDAKEKFEGLDDDVLAEILGKPDKIFYSKRGKKTYEYFITSGKQCDKPTNREGFKIVFEINSIGYVNLVYEKKF